MDLTKKIAVFYDSVVDGGSAKDYRIDVVKTDIPREVFNQDCQDISSVLKSDNSQGRFGKAKNDWPALMYRRDADGDIINYDLNQDDFNKSGWVKVDANGDKTTTPINGTEDSCRVGGFTTSRNDVAQRVIELFQEKGYSVAKQFE